MSRRCFSQPSLADAFVKAYSRSGGFLDDIAKTAVTATSSYLMREVAAAVKAERAGLLSFYAARIEAVRRGATPAAIAAAIRALLQERSGAPRYKSIGRS